MDFVAAIKKILANDKIASIFAAACFFQFMPTRPTINSFGMAGNGQSNNRKI